MRKISKITAAALLTVTVAGTFTACGEQSAPIAFNSEAAKSEVSKSEVSKSEVSLPTINDIASQMDKQVLSSKKLSAESTCMSIQTLVKSYLATVINKKGGLYSSEDMTVDMDSGEGELTLREYLHSQIPEIKNEGNYATVTIKDGNVDAVTYQENDISITWTASAGWEKAKTPDSPSEGNGVMIILL